MQPQTWIKPRAKALGKTLAGLGQAMGGLDGSRITEIIAGTRRVQHEEARLMAEYLEMVPEEVYGRFFGSIPSVIGDVRDARPASAGPARDTPRVYAARDLGSGIVEISPDTAGPVFPGVIVPRPFSCYVTTDHMAPRYEVGDDLQIDPALPAAPGCDVLLIAGSPGEQVRATLRRLVDKTETHWIVRQWNPEKTEKLERRTWRPLRVAGMRPRG